MLSETMPAPHVTNAIQQIIHMIRFNRVYKVVCAIEGQALDFVAVQGFDFSTESKKNRDFLVKGVRTNGTTAKWQCSIDDIDVEVIEEYSQYILSAPHKNNLHITCINVDACASTPGV